MNILPPRSTSTHAPRPSRLSLTCLLTLALAQSVAATPLYWDGNGTTAGAGNTTALLNKVWGTDAMWNSDAAGVTNTFTASTTSSDDLFFVAAPGAASGAITFNPTVTGIQAANSITFQSSGAQTLSGGTINIGAGGITGAQYAYSTTNRGTVTISSALALQAGQSWINNAATAMTVSGAISGTGNLAIQNTSSGAFTLSNASINNTGLITNSGSGAGTTTISGVVGSAVTGITQNSATSLLSVTGANTAYAGTTTLTTGTLRGTNTAATNVLQAFGTGGITLNGGTLQLKANGTGGSQTITVANAVTTGASATTIDVNNNSSNTGNQISLASLTVGTGQLNVTGGNTYTLRVGGTTTLNGNVTLNPTTAGLSLVGVVGDGGNNYGITKIGTGTLTLSGANTYTGSTSVLAGQLNVNANAPSGSAGVLGNATSAVLLGDTSGSATATLNVNGDYTVGRDISVQAGGTGIVTIGSTSQSVGSSILSGGIALGRDAAFVTGDYHTLNVSGVVSGAGAISVLGGISTSKMLFSGNNSYTGGTTNNGAVLIVGHNNALGTGTITMNGGALGSNVAGVTLANNQIWAGNFSGSYSAGNALTTTGTNTITSGTRIVSFNTTGANINGTIADGGNNYGLILRNTTNAAAVGLGGANTFGGGLTISGTTGQALTVTTSNASAAGSGQTTLTNNTGSVLKLGGALTVDSLTSGLSAPAITTAGSGYTNGTQDLVFTGGGGSGATGTATISSGVITSLLITNYGRDYTSAPTVTLTTPGAGTGGAITSTFGNSSVNLQANTLTLAGTNASPATYVGVISGTGGNIIKNGAGSQTLTGVSTYTGSTTVSNGTLNISGAGSIGGTSGITVNGGNFAYNTSVSLFKAVTLSSGVVSGTGNLLGGITANGGLLTSTGTASAVTLNSGGGINPNGSGVAGTFNAASLTWNSNDTVSGLRFDLGATQVASDSISLSGNFNKGSGSTFVFAFNDVAAAPSMTYTLLTFAGTDFASTDFSATGVAGTFGIDYGAGTLSFTVNAIPEPSTYAAILGTLALAGVFIHRRRRSRVA